MEQIAANVKAVLNSIADGIIIIDRDYSIVFANKAIHDLCGGLKAADFIGRKCHDIFHRCPSPCPGKCLSEVLCPHDEAFRSGKTAAVIHSHIMPDSTERIFSITSSPLRDKEGEVALFIETLRDITEQRRAEEELKRSEAFIKNILESVGEGFIIIDPEYKIISANKAYCEQVKSPSCDIIGRHCYEVSHHSERPCFENGEECAPARTFKSGAPSVAIHTHYDSVGKPLYIETQSYAMRDETGRVIAVIETLKNITEIRLLEEQLRHAQKMEAIGTLSGGIAHDFNNILNIIIGYGELMLAKMKEGDPFVSQLKEIIAAGDKAAQLTRGLLAFSRKQVLETRPVDINKIIEDFKKMLERTIGEDIELRITKSPEALIVNADSGQIEQVMMNLAVNAKDAMPQGGALTIQTGSLSMDDRFINANGFGEPGNYAVISITDTGIGMDEATRMRIFEPYFTTKDLGRGTGLGLSIAFGIVKQHKGFLKCQSKSGKGTTFNIYLPLSGSAAEKKVEKAEAPASRGMETVLIAEDDAQLRALVKDILEDYGYDVIEAADGEDAVRRYSENKDRIKLALLDVIMPKKSGKETYEDIKLINPDIKAIFVSGYASPVIQDREILGNGPEFVQKPVAPDRLLKKIREVLDK